MEVIVLIVITDFMGVMVFIDIMVIMVVMVHDGGYGPHCRYGHDGGYGPYCH